jgi:hypothetical protein
LEYLTSGGGRSPPYRDAVRLRSVEDEAIRGIVEFQRNSPGASHPMRSIVRCHVRALASGAKTRRQDRTDRQEEAVARLRSGRPNFFCYSANAYHLWNVDEVQ